MGKIYESIEELIGHTPLVRINHFAESEDVTGAVLLAKVELFNPAGSIKDRVALSSRGASLLNLPRAIPASGWPAWRQQGVTG